MGTFFGLDIRHLLNQRFFLQHPTPVQVFFVKYFESISEDEDLFRHIMRIMWPSSECNNLQ